MRLSKEAFQIDAHQWCTQIEAFINNAVHDACRDGIVVPISGELDSSVVAALCVRAIGRDHVVGLMLPERLGNPEAITYGRMIARHLGIKTETFNISPVLRGLRASNLFMSAISGRTIWEKAVKQWLQRQGHSTQDDYLNALKGKIDPAYRKRLAVVTSKQRARLLVTYKFAEENNFLVAGSAHRTEQLAGLFVKYGIDDAADIMPLKNMYRSQTLQLAEFLEIPRDILHRSPNPDIVPGITDKYRGYFGIDYLKVELILLGLQTEMTVSEIAGQLGLAEQTVQLMKEVFVLSESLRSHAAAPVLDQPFFTDSQSHP